MVIFNFVPLVIMPVLLFQVETNYFEIQNIIDRSSIKLIKQNSTANHFHNREHYVAYPH